MQYSITWTHWLLAWLFTELLCSTSFLFSSVSFLQWISKAPPCVILSKQKPITYSGQLIRKEAQPYAEFTLHNFSPDIRSASQIFTASRYRAAGSSGLSYRPQYQRAWLRFRSICILFFLFCLWAANQHADHWHHKLLTGYHFTNLSSLVWELLSHSDLALFPHNFSHEFDCETKFAKQTELFRFFLL